METQTLEILKVGGLTDRLAEDCLAVEEPLEIRLTFGPHGNRITKSLSITMRTPGHDLELARGFLFTEGLIRDRRDLLGVIPCGTGGNTVRAELDPSVDFDFAKLERHFYATSSCGVCGKSSLEALRVKGLFEPAQSTARVTRALIHSLPAALRAAQDVFDSTGGLHASALFDLDGRLLAIREDVGRHNALDKLIGSRLESGALPLGENVLLVSGRASFELVQKAKTAGISIFAAVGAPSSLAVALAKDCGMTLVGFVRDSRFNVYCGQERIVG